MRFRKKRYRNFGTLNDRAMIKARQSLDFKSWYGNVLHNVDIAKLKMEQRKAVREEMKEIKTEGAKKEINL